MSIFGSIMSKIFGKHDAAAFTPDASVTAQSASASAPVGADTSPQPSMSPATSSTMPR